MPPSTRSSPPLPKMTSSPGPPPARLPPAVAEDDVVPRPAPEVVGPGPAVDQVVAGSADDRVVPAVAVDRQGVVPQRGRTGRHGEPVVPPAEEHRDRGERVAVERLRQRVVAEVDLDEVGRREVDEVDRDGVTAGRTGDREGVVRDGGESDGRRIGHRAVGQYETTGERDTRSRAYAGPDRDV